MCSKARRAARIAHSQRMHAAKAKLKTQQLEESYEKSLNDTIDHMQDSAIVRRGVFTRKRKKSSERCQRQRFALKCRRLRLKVCGETRYHLRISLHTMIDIGQHNTGSVAELTRTYKLSHRSVRRLQCLCSAVINKLQDLRLACISDNISEIDFCVDSIAWDETEETLKLRLCTHAADEDAKFCQNTAGKWHVLVAKESLFVGHGDHHHQASLPIIRSVVPLISTSAEAIFHGLFETCQAIQIEQFRMAMMSASKLSAVHHDCDGASSNVRMLAHRMRALPYKVKSSAMLCNNHQNQATEVSINGAFGVDMIAALFTTAL